MRCPHCDLGLKPIPRQPEELEWTPELAPANVWYCGHCECAFPANSALLKPRQW
jgi:hypothetical protein